MKEPTGAFGPHLTDAGFPVKEAEAEFAVHDDGRHLHRGWIDESTDGG